jgi:hypothetical protein
LENLKLKKTKMDKKTIAIGIAVILTLFILGLVSAMYAGECLSVNLSNMTSLDDVVYTVVGNSSNLEGLTINLNGTIASICTVVNYKPDNFTIIFIDNSTKEIVKEVRSGGGGGGTRYVDRNITVEKEIEKIIYVNQTGEPEVPIEPEEENFIWVYALCGILVLAIILMWYKVLRDERNKEKKERNSNGQ